MKRIDFTNEDLSFIINNYKNNTMTILELAKKFNCSSSTIERRLKENNIILKPRFKYEDLTNKVFGQLTVIKENKERYEQDLKTTNKPHHYWWCKCSCGNSELIQVESSHLKNGHTQSCGCIKSKAEKIITNILQTNNINFKSEYSFKDLKGINNGILRFDFAIFDNDFKKLKYLIEYNGKQHYIQNGGWNDKEEYENRIKNDNIKIEYCKQRNIPLIIIPYTIKPENITLNILLLEGDNKNAYLA